MSNIVSNCPLCTEHGLHVMGEKDVQILQCLNCGYVSSPKFMGKKETNEEYQKLTDEMKNWSKTTDDRIWIPTIMTLPVGILYPHNDDDGNMKWLFAEMKEIPENERHKYPNGQGGNYESLYDTDNPIVYDKFLEGMAVLTEKMKQGDVKLQKMDTKIED